MENSQLKSNNQARDSNITDDTGIKNGGKKATGRRLQDAITSKNPNRKLNLDRRATFGDRRDNTDPHYKGPARRNTIDTRDAKDRRNND
jgi:hypothetical protein